jgi:uncharacterized protein (TIGR02246 family)
VIGTALRPDPRPKKEEIVRALLFWALALFALVLPLSHQAGWAGKGEGTSADKSAIAKNAEAFIEAFHKGDAKALAAFWTADGDYTEQSGTHMKGREAIEKSFEKFFADNKGLKVRIESDSLRFVTPDVAIEDGTSFVIPPDGAPPSRARYTIIHVKKDGKWLLGSVRDVAYTPPGNYEHLRGLEWAVGDWSAEGKGEAEHLSLAWADNRNFLVGTFAATVRGVSVGKATHWVGWDPQAKRVRSWIFDAAGGFGEGAWTRDGDKWVVKTKSVLQDGKDATATFVLSRGEGDTLTLQLKDRTVDGKPVPDTREIMLKRAK